MTFHIHLDIEGAIRNGSCKGFTDEHGHPVRPAVARDMLRLKLARGEKYLLVGKTSECPNFSPETGCPGHPDKPEDKCPKCGGQWKLWNRDGVKGRACENGCASEYI